jgi:hypothetical protein
VSESAFVPPGFEPPRVLAVGELRLEPLGPEHNERDFAAWTSSMDHIRSSPGWAASEGWPREMTLDDNQGDLERHARDFLDGSGFTYTVLDRSDDVVGVSTSTRQTTACMMLESSHGFAGRRPRSMVPSGGRWPPGSQAMRGHSRDRSTSRYFPDGWISSRGSSGPRFQPSASP